MKSRTLASLLVWGLLALPGSAHSQDFKKWEAQVLEYKKWLEVLARSEYRFWTALDRKSRPYRVYVGDGFHNASRQMQEEFVDTFSRYLAGHPEKFALIDLFDGATGRPIGEFGWGGFRLY
jgi:hypothetical protein